MSATGYRSVRFTEIAPTGVSQQSHNIIEEAEVCIYLNGEELTTLMCSPVDLIELAVGFLRSEDLIQTMEDIEAITVARSSSCVDILLKDTSARPTKRHVVTSGCGGGVTFLDLAEVRDPLPQGIPVKARSISDMMMSLIRNEGIRGAARGVHSSALGRNGNLVLVAEDIGRHNSVDRLWGKALISGVDVSGIDPAGSVLLTSGRISSEMVFKAARLGVPIIASRSCPTTLACELADRLGVAVCGYVRPPRMNIYTHAQRIIIDNDDTTS